MLRLFARCHTPSRIIHIPRAPKLIGDDPRYERWRWRIFGITWLAYAGFYLTRKSFSVAKIELAKPEAMGLSDTDMSRIDGAFLVAYAIGQFVCGIAGDKFGTRRVVLAGGLSAMFELAGVFSVVVAGLLSDRMFGSRRMPVSIIYLVLLAGALCLLDDLPATRWVLGASLFVIGMLTYAPDSLISGTATVDVGTKKGASTASGLVNGAGSVGAIIGGTLPGLVQER